MEDVKTLTHTYENSQAYPSNPSGYLVPPLLNAYVFPAPVK